MREIQIEFLPDQSWRWIWGIAGIAVLCMIGFTALQIWQFERQISQLRAKRAEIQARLQAGNARAHPENPRQKDAARLAKLLQMDPNKPFAVIENMREPGTKLIAFDLDAPADTLRLEYEIDSVSSASALTSALNAGYEQGPWQLTSLNAAAKSNAIAGMSTSQVMRGTWVALVSRL
jgi:type II secretory pathway component PulL